MATHIVHKQKADLKISRSEDSFALQSRVSYLLKHELPKKMELIFDEFSKDEIIRIEKLHLDLKTINSINFEKEFEERFIEELQNELSKIMKGNSQNADVVIVRKETSLLHSLIYFLEHGYLAWYDSVRQMQLWEEEILNHLPEKDWEYFFNWLKNYSANNQIIKRLVLQFSDRFLHFIISKMNVYPADVFKDVYEDLLFILQIVVPDQKKDTYKNFLWQNIIKVLLIHGKSETEYWLLKNIFSKRDDLRNVFRGLKKDELMRNIKTVTIQNAVEKFIEPSTGKDDDLIFEEDVIPKQKQQVEKDSLYVNDCGIVILHPFLEMYFTELGLMMEKQFVNDDACKRSVLLLHYLATGEKQVAEFDLVLQKILCGLPIEETLPSAIEPSEKEVTESENLLRSVMNYWPPLKNTSIEGLRQTFLQRDGKLSQTQTGWLLRIEQKTVDILIGKLPWGFSTIQLPWIKDFLSVEWC